MLGLLDQMEAEHPEDPSLVPKARMFWAEGNSSHVFLQLDDWACRPLGSGPAPMSSMYKCSKN